MPMLWPAGCEQAICIEKYNECIVCRFSPQGCGSLAGTEKELADIAEGTRRRNNQQEQ